MKCQWVSSIQITNREDMSEESSATEWILSSLYVFYSGSLLACSSASLAAFSSASTTSTSNGNVRIAAIPVSWLSSA